MSYLNLRQAHSLWVLGWALVKHVLLVPFVGRRGPRPWLDRIARESLGPVPKEAWRLFAGTSRCIGCGLCDGVGEVSDTPSRWILSAARCPADAELGLTAAARLEVLAPNIERVCPTRVAVGDVVRLIRGNHGALAAR
ncbi:MAG: hypothetical protein HY903_22215 [Deltaproteobacteria bacterium]|nr:hypothetical protein [Deltaproteobacteria bacterium]